MVSDFDLALTLIAHMYGVPQEKQAARAGVRQLRRLFQNPHTLGEAEQLASRAGHLLAGRNLPHGAQLKMLGAGSEGVAQHVLRPGAAGTLQHAADPLAARQAGSFATRASAQQAAQAAQAAQRAPTPLGHQQATGQGGSTQVLKTHDPTADLYNPAVMANKERLVGKQLPGFAQIHESKAAPNLVHGQRAPAFFSEYVPGQSLSASQARHRQLAQPIQQQAKHVAPGMELLDVRPENMIQDPRTGQAKAIDYMPVEKKDLLPDQFRSTSEADTGRMFEHINPVSATGQQFSSGEHSIRAPMEHALHQHYVDLSGRFLPHIQKNDQATFARENARLSRHYGGQLLGQAYGKAGRTVRGYTPRHIPQAPAPTAGPPQSQGFGFGPPQSQGFGFGPPQSQGFGPPQSQGFGFGPPQSQGFGPPQSQGFGPPKFAYVSKPFTY